MRRYSSRAAATSGHDEGGGGATGADVRHTMAAVQAAVREKFAVDLTPEPIFL